MKIRLDISADGESVFFFSRDKSLRTLLAPFASGSDREYVRVPLTYAYSACTMLRDMKHETVGSRAAIATVKAHEPVIPQAEKLFPFQHEGVRFLVHRRKALLAYEMGLGKTVTALTALHAKRGTLIICPKVMVGTWYDEACKWRSDLAVQIHQKPHSIFPNAGEIIIIPYSQLPQEDIALVEQRFGYPIPKWTGLHSGMRRPRTPLQLVIDEAHYLKNPRSHRTQVVRAIASLALSTWLLTGTPLLNEPPELWSLLEAVGAERDVFWSWSHFQDMFGAVRKTIYIQGQPRNVIDHWSTEPSKEALARLASFMLRRTRMEVLPDLPTKTHRDVLVDVKPKDMREMPLAAAMMNSMSDDAVLNACSELGAMSEARAKLVMCKLHVLDELLDEYEKQSVPVVVFSYHRGPIEHLKERPGWKAILGDTPTGLRNEYVKGFQGGYYKGLAGTIGAMGVGVTLTYASHMIFVDQSYVPAENLQAEDRECRIAQKNAVLITRLIAHHPIDERVSAILDRKMALLENMGLAL